MMSSSIIKAGKRRITFTVMLRLKPKQKCNKLKYKQYFRYSRMKKEYLTFSWTVRLNICVRGITKHICFNLSKVKGKEIQ